MERFISSIRENIKSENWYGALFMSLTMPDICGKISYPELKFSGERYKEWFDENLADIFIKNHMDGEKVFLTASDCWALRCSLLHSGRDDISGEKSQEILAKFDFNTLESHFILIDDVLAINVGYFCEEICTAVEVWYGKNKSTTEVSQYIETVIKIKTGGFYPKPGIKIGTR